MDNMGNFTFKTYMIKVYNASTLPIMTLIGAIAGVITAIFMERGEHEEGYAVRTLMYVGFLGDLLMQLLQFIVLPLIIASLICSVGVFENIFSRRIGIQFIILIVMMKIVSVCLGIALALIVHPTFIGDDPELFSRNDNNNIDSVLDILRQLFPPNIIEMTLKTKSTSYSKPENGSSNMYDWEYMVEGESISCPNLMGVMCCSLILGIALVNMKSEGKPLYEFFVCVFHAIMVIVYWILWMVPVMIISLVASQLLKWRNTAHILTEIGHCIAVMILGFFILCGFVYPLLYFVGTYRNPFKYMKLYLNPMLNAFATSSSSATVPISIGALRDAGISSTLVNEILPIAHNINKDGGALYIGAAAIFVAQLNHLPLSLGCYASIVLMGTAVSLVSLGIPFGTTICLVLLLDTMGLPSKDIGMFLAVDVIIDRLESVVNILGDTVILAILEKENIELLQKFDAGEMD